MATPESGTEHSSTQPSRDPEPLLLLSGSGLQPWIWEEFISELPAGTPVTVAKRPASGDGSLATYVEHAVAAAPAERFTIVAHSLGAIVGLAVASAAPDRVAAFVAIAGVVPDPPGSFLSAMPIPNRWVLSIAMRIAGTRPPDKAIRKSLTGGLDSAVADRIVDQFEPDSSQVFRSKISRTDQPQRRGYVTTSNDSELPPKLQQRFIAALAPEWTSSINTGHLPMLENPSGLAAAILDFVRRPTP